jgi:3-hydroxybutyryl-CoA dehydrogenase
MAIERLGIVGSGIMGSGIAELAAKAGVDVVLRTRKLETADALVEGLGQA